MSIPIGAAGLSFSNLTEIRDSAKTLMALASVTGMDAETESLSMSLLRKVDALSADSSPDDFKAIERVFANLKQHLEETDSAMATLMVGSMNGGAHALDRIVSGVSSADSGNAGEFEKKRSGAGGAAWLQMQLSHIMDSKRSGNAGEFVQRIQKQMHTMSVADIDLEEAQSVMEEIKANLVDGIQGMDEIRLLKKLMGSVPGLIVMFPNLLDDLKSALTEFLVSEIHDMTPEDAKMFISEVVGMLSEAVGVDIFSDDQIEEIVQIGAKDPAAMDTLPEEADASGTSVPTIMAASIANPMGPILINPLLMQGHAPAGSVDMKIQTSKTAAIESGDRSPHAKEPMERVKEVLAALERLFYENLNDSGNILETVLTKLQKSGGI